MDLLFVVILAIFATLAVPVHHVALVAVELHGVQFVQLARHGVFGAVGASVLPFHEHGAEFFLLFGGEFFEDLFPVVDAGGGFQAHFLMQLVVEFAGRDEIVFLEGGVEIDPQIVDLGVDGVHRLAL